MEAVYVAAKTNKSPLRPKESTEIKMLFQCDVMLMIASPKEDNFRFSLLVTLQSKRSIIYLLERIGEMLRAIFVGLFNDTFTTKLMITLMIIPQTTAAIQSQPSVATNIQQGHQLVDQSEPQFYIKIFFRSG